MPEDQNADAQQRMLEEQHRRDVDTIIHQGRERYGSDNFDDACSTVAQRMGARSQEFMGVAKSFDDPVRLISDLAEDPQQLERFSKMPTARQIVELGRIEARASGHVATGTEPAWKRIGPNGRMSNADWNSGMSDKLDDATWNREFERRQKERRERKGW